MATKTAKANINDEKKTLKVKEFLQYDFTQEELKEFTSELARTTQEKSSLEKEKTAVTSEFKAKIDAKAASTENLSRKITNGSEHRYIDCELAMNTPKNGRKTLTRLDTAEIVWEKNMTAEEMQLKLDVDTSDSEVAHSEYQDNHK